MGLVCGDDGNHNDDDYDAGHLGQVGGQELEDEGEGGLGVDDVVQSHNVGVAQLLQQARLSRGDHNEEGGEEGEGRQKDQRQKRTRLALLSD